MSENKVRDAWEGLIRGLPVEYHKPLADRVVGALGVWIPEEHTEDAINYMRYHKNQILDIQRHDEQCSRY